MIKKISTIILISLILFLNNCKAPTTVVFDEGKLHKGMSRKDMAKVLRFSVLTAHNPFRSKCFHEYYPLKKRVNYKDVIEYANNNLENKICVYLHADMCVTDDFGKLKIFDKKDNNLAPPEKSLSNFIYSGRCTINEIVLIPNSL